MKRFSIRLFCDGAVQIDTVRHFTYSHCKDSDQSANSSLEAGVVCVVEGFPFDIGVKERY